MTLPALATLLLCLFASVLIIARPAGAAMAGARIAATLILAFVLGGMLALVLRPAIAVLSMVAGILCAMSLLRAMPAWMSAALAGFGLGLGMAGLLPVDEYAGAAVVAWLAGLAAPLAALRFRSRGGEFAPAVLVDQGQCAVVIAAPVIAALPGAAEGWRSALALAGAGSADGAASPGPWLLLPLLALAAGMFHRFWSKK